MDYNSIIILGPTASGKTDLSIKLAKKINSEIINADSIQIYKDLNIGSAKIKKEEMQGIPHHLLDFVDCKENFSVNQYREEANKKIKELLNKNIMPIIVGGTGFYIESLLNNYNYGSTYKDEKLRKELEQQAKEYGNEYVYNILKNIDIESANKLHYNDLKRVIRAIEIYKVSGKRKSELSTMQTTTQSLLNPLIIILNWDRDVLYSRINLRVNKMIENGLVEEVKSLKLQGLNTTHQSMQAIGYKEILLYLNNEITLDEAIEKIKKSSRNYAKRQITWFKRFKNAYWFNLNNTTLNDVINQITTLIKKA